MTKENVDSYKQVGGTISFSTLPPEIIERIFLQIDANLLYSLKHVCSYWLKCINKLLNIKVSKVSGKTFETALAVFMSWRNKSNGTLGFTLYQSQYPLKNMIHQDVLNRIGPYMIREIKLIDYMELISQLKGHARRGGAYSRGCEDVIGSTWQTIIGMTGSKYTIEDLRHKEPTDSFVKSFMERYTWYSYFADDMVGIIWDAGFICLYPDRRTFTLLFATDCD